MGSLERNMHPLSLSLSNSPYLRAPASAEVASQGAILSLPLLTERRRVHRGIVPYDPGPGARLSGCGLQAIRGCRSGLAMCPERLRIRGPVPFEGRERAEETGWRRNPPRADWGSGLHELSR